MKVLYVLRRFPAISNTFIISEIVEILKRGHRVGIISLSRTGTHDMDAHPEVREYSLIERTAYISRGSVLMDMLRHPTSYLERHYSACWEPDIKMDIITARILGEIRRGDYDVVHAHFAAENSLFAAAAAHAAGVPFTFTTHAFDLYDREKSLPAERLCKMVSMSHRTVTISDYNRRHIGSVCTNTSGKVEVVHCGLEIDKYEYSFNPSAREVLTVARLVEKKGIDTLIRAIGMMKDRKTTLHIVGDGHLRDELEALARDSAVNAVFHGHIDDASLRRLHRSAAVFVLPCRIASSGDRDGIPVSLMEAMALGIPVVSTTVSGIPELINDRSGILVEPDNPATLAEAISELMDDRTRAEALAEGARRRIETEFTIEKSVSRLLEIWGEGR